MGPIFHLRFLRRRRHQVPGSGRSRQSVAASPPQRLSIPRTLFSESPISNFSTLEMRHSLPTFNYYTHRYAFSWSPSGVLKSALMPARYREDGKDVSLSGHDKLAGATPFTAFPALNLEVMPTELCFAHRRRERRGVSMEDQKTGRFSPLDS